MDRATLEGLAADGFAQFSATESRDLVAWCWDWGIATGDARYCVLWRALKAVDEWWDPEQGIPTQFRDDVDAVLRWGVTNTLNAADAASGAQFAHEMGMALVLPRTPDAWRALGWTEGEGA